MHSTKAVTTAAGTTTIVTAVAGRTVLVKRLFLVAAATATVQVQDTAANNLTGVMTMTTGVPFDFELEPIDHNDGIFNSAVGTGIQLVTTGGAVNGAIWFDQ